MSPVGAAWHDLVDAARTFSRPARLYLLASFSVWMGRGIQTVLFNLYLAEAGFKVAFVGNVLAMTGAGLAVAAIPAGLLADRWGRRRCLVLGVVVEGLGLLVRSCVVAPAAILASSFVAGLGLALVSIATLPFLTEHSTSRERTHLFSAAFAVALLAGVAGSAIAGALPAALLALPGVIRPGTLVAYRSALVVAGVCALAGLLPLARLRGLHGSLTAYQRTQEPAGSWRPLLPIALNFLLFGCGAGLVIPFMNLYFKNRFGCSSAQIGTFFAIAAVITAVAALAGPALARRFGTLRTAVAFELLSLPCLVSMGAETRLATAVAAFWLRATLMQAATPLLNSFVMEALPARLRARSSSISNLMFNLGGAVSAASAGVLIQRWGYALPFYITAVLYATASISFYLSFRNLPVIAVEPRIGQLATSLRGGGPLAG